MMKIYMRFASMFFLWIIVSCPSVASQGSVSDRKIMTIRIGHLTLTVPQGYISSTDISAKYRRSYDYLKLAALLPCFAPETARNTAEFHKSTLSRIIWITLGGNHPGLDGRKMFETEGEISPFIKKQTESRDYELYSNAFKDVYVFGQPSAPLIVECDGHRIFVKFPWCTVRQRVWGDTLLLYDYEQNITDSDIDMMLVIDEKVHRLLTSFVEGTNNYVETNTDNCQ